jgi:hypothetical protein
MIPMRGAGRDYQLANEKQVNSGIHPDGLSKPCLCGAGHPNSFITDRGWFKFTCEQCGASTAAKKYHDRAFHAWNNSEVTQQSRAHR